VVHQARSLRLGADPYKRIGRDLRWAVKNQFGSFTRARAMLGLKDPPPWTKGLVLASLKDLGDRGWFTYGRIESEARPILSATARLGGILAAISWAGLETGCDPKLKWTTMKPKDVLRNAWKRRELRVNVLKKLYGGGICPAARREYGSWRNALRAVGIPARPRAEMGGRSSRPPPGCTSPPRIASSSTT
jgi:hypothetical protein